jgi:hypothetical protein
LHVLVEQRIYDINPGTPMTDFLDSYERLGLPAQKRILGGFLGYFTTEFGTQNQVRHFWAFADLEDRRRRRQALAEDSGWQECIAVVRPMIVRWENTIMYPTSFSPIRDLPVDPHQPLTAFTYGEAS